MGRKVTSHAQPETVKSYNLHCFTRTKGSNHEHVRHRYHANCGYIAIYANYVSTDPTLSILKAPAAHPANSRRRSKRRSLKREKEPLKLLTELHRCSLTCSLP